MTNYQLRAAQADDASALAQVHVETWQAAYAGLLPDAYLQSLSANERERMWTIAIANAEAVAASRQITVAVADGCIVGFVAVGPVRDADLDEGTRELFALYVRPDCWGTGIGHALLLRGVAGMGRLGGTHAALWVLTTNMRARRFYEAHGWRADGVTKTDWSGDVPLDETRYRLSTLTTRVSTDLRLSEPERPSWPEHS